MKFPNKIVFSSVYSNTVDQKASLSVSSSMHKHLKHTGLRIKLLKLHLTEILKCLQNMASSNLKPLSFIEFVSKRGYGQKLPVAVVQGRCKSSSKATKLTLLCVKILLSCRCVCCSRANTW